MSDRASAQVRDWIDHRADEMADLLARLVACDTENPPGRGLPGCAELIRQEMARLGFRPEILKPAPTATLSEPRIVRGTAGDGENLLYFHGHFDAFPAQDRAQFTAKRRGGMITGRGTADMNGGIVSMLYGAAAARELGLLRGGRIVIHLVCDEETGSSVGSGYLREHNLIDPGALEGRAIAAGRCARPAQPRRAGVQGHQLFPAHAQSRRPLGGVRAPDERTANRKRSASSDHRKREA